MKEVEKLFAGYLRKESTKAEKLVWELLRERKFMNYKFRRQHAVEGFVLDFYCHELRIGIEIDGGIHLKQKEYDILRQEIIESEGITILRFENREILEGKRSILKKLGKLIKSQPLPLPLGEGGERW